MINQVIGLCRWMMNVTNRKVVGRMKEQIAKLMYVWIVNCFSLLSKRLPVKKRLVYLMSFPKNENGFLKNFMEQSPNIEVVLLYDENCKEEAKAFEKMGAKTYLLTSTIPFLKRAVNELMQAKVIVCDNYFPLLAGFYPKKKTTIIQLWHANGAIKRFGLEDPTAMKRSFLDRKRFKQVYKRFDEYIVGSEYMGKVFQKSYGATEKQIIPIGYPRSDVYFNEEDIESKRTHFYEIYPHLKNKKIILYAPTYRENSNAGYPLDIPLMFKELGNSYAVLMKKHPKSLEHIVVDGYKDFFYADLDDFKTEELMTVAECLITDYSSVPFDFTLLENAKKIIFYWYDQEDYEKQTGIQNGFIEYVPGEIVHTMEEVVSVIKSENDNEKMFNKFNQKWNTYNDGWAKYRLVNYIQKKISGSEARGVLK